MPWPMEAASAGVWSGKARTLDCEALNTRPKPAPRVFHEPSSAVSNQQKGGVKIENAGRRTIARCDAMLFAACGTLTQK